MTPAISQPGRATRAEIDRSVRGPVLFCFTSAVFWLVIGSLLQTVAGTKLVWPGFLDGGSFFTFGRVQPAGMTALVYGWASLAGIGFGIWLLARSSGIALKGIVFPVCCLVLWNLALLGGVLGILAGGGSGIAYLDMPGPAAFALFLAFALLVIWMFMTLRGARGQPAYVAKAFFVAGLFCFAWLFASANGLLVWGRSPGSVIGPIHGWFENGLFGLWLTFLSMSALFYFLPLAAGRPLQSRSLASFAFWGLLFFGGWGGMRYFIGGPIPAWMASASIVASILLILPALAAFVNFHGTIGDAAARLWESGTARFLMLGAASYAFWVGGNAFVAFPTMSSIFHFTIYDEAMPLIALYGFVTMTLVGAIYTLLPSLGHPAPSCAPCCHFWTALTGLGCIAVAAPIGGLLQGFALHDPEVDFLNAIDYATPFRLLILLGQFAFLVASLGFAVAVARALYAPARMAAPTEAQPVPQHVEVVA